MILSDTRLAALFLVSVCVLAFEIEMMRVFSVASWSNFGSMVISIALLGFGLAGTLLTLAGKRVRVNPDRWLSSSAFALGPSMAFAYIMSQRVPFNPVLIATDSSQLWWIASYYALYGIPFFVSGLFIGSIFTILSGRIHQLYFWNMVGSGFGGLLILGFMFLFPPDFLIYPVIGLATLPALLCCVRWRRTDAQFDIRFPEVLLAFSLAAVGLFLVGRYGSLNVSDFKPESYARKYPDSRMLYHAYSPLGETRVFASSYFHFAPGLSDNAGVTLRKMPQNAFLGMFVDGNGPVGIMRKLDPEEENYIDFLPMSAPYHLLPNPSVLILRLGGGAGIHTALHNGARAVTVVEPNPDLVHMLHDVPFFREYTGNMLEDPRVSVRNEEVRSFAGSTAQRFDLVEIGLIDSIGLSQAGGFSVEENYLYTVEALKDYLKCLAPGGILSVTVWDRLSPPRNVPKLLSTAVQSLRELGVPHPEKRLFVFNLLLSTATVLIKNGDFDEAEIGSLRQYCRRMSFEADYFPGIPDGTADFPATLAAYRALYQTDAQSEATGSATPELLPSKLYRSGLQWMLVGKQAEFYHGYVFDVRPATDERPYYSGYLKLPSVPQFLSKLGEIPEEWGYLLLLGTFLQSVLFGLLIILLPMITRWRELFRKRRGTLAVIVYFSCLGLGYMLAEIFLIQRFVFFLADPVYTNSLVITILLISSAFGNLIGDNRSLGRNAAVIISVIGIVCCILFYLFGLSSVLEKALGVALPLKALLAALLIAPFGVCLGIPFPTGLAAIAESRRGILPWAWGVNGALSVTGAALTRIVSTALGFKSVLVAVAALYLLAGFLFKANTTGRENEGLSE
jgi:spermidine synthase